MPWVRGCLEITPKSNGLIHNEKYKDDLKVWTVASKNANGRFKREKLTFLVCNRSFDDDWMCFFDIYTMYFKDLFHLF